MTVPIHKHAVELRFVRYEFVAAYKLAERSEVWLRAPYDVKERTASVEFVDLVEPPTADIDAMQRNLNIHHPTETLEGFSDFSLLFVGRGKDAVWSGDILAFAVGTSIPVGKTEENPYLLGDAGLPHEHIQFGTGTFDPLLELYYFTPISGRFSASANALCKFPLYENDKRYRGPIELSAGLSLAFAPTDRLSLRAGWSFYHQSYAHWDGERDINSGLIANGAVGGASYKVSNGLFLSLDVFVPVSQSTLADGGDTFEQGTVVQLGMSHSF